MTDPDVRARLARVKDHLQRNGLFALTADQLDQLAATERTAMTLFEPRQTRTWSTRELDALIGKQVAVNVNGSETEGLVMYASVGRGESAFIEFDDGRTVEWRRDTDDVTIDLREEKP